MNQSDILEMHKRHPDYDLEFSIDLRISDGYWWVDVSNSDWCISKTIGDLDLDALLGDVPKIICDICAEIQEADTNYKQGKTTK